MYATDPCLPEGCPYLILSSTSSSPHPLSLMYIFKENHPRGVCVYACFGCVPRYFAQFVLRNMHDVGWRGFKADCVETQWSYAGSNRPLYISPVVPMWQQISNTFLCLDPSLSIRNISLQVQSIFFVFTICIYHILNWPQCLKIDIFSRYNRKKHIWPNAGKLHSIIILSTFLSVSHFKNNWATHVSWQLIPYEIYWYSILESLESRFTGSKVHRLQRQKIGLY